MIGLLDWHFELDGQPTYLHPVQLPPGTTMFFEMHRRNSTLGKTRDVSHAYQLKLFLWTPWHGRVEVRMHGCTHSWNCSMHDFFGKIHQHLTRTGTFQEICHIRDGLITHEKCSKKYAHEIDEHEPPQRIFSMLNFEDDLPYKKEDEAGATRLKKHDGNAGGRLEHFISGVLFGALAVAASLAIRQRISRAGYTNL